MLDENRVVEAQEDQKVPAAKTSKYNVAVELVAVLLAVAIVAAALYSSLVVNQLQNGVASLDDRLGQTELNVATLTGRADANDARVNEIECAADNAWDAAGKANTRADKRVEAENRKYKQMLAYIRGANPSSSLVKLTDKEVDRLLTNGVWDIEPKIEAEYNDLVSKTAMSAADRANKAQIAANVGQMLGDQASRKAEQALVAGEAAVNGLQKIADQPNKFLGKSVTKSTKEAITADLAEYWRQYDAANGK